MEPAKTYVDKAPMSFPPMDEMSWLDDERPIDVAVETPTEGVSGVAENEFLNEPVIIYAYLNYQSAMHYGSEERPIDVAVETVTVGAKGVAENESLNELVEIHSYLGNQSSVDYRADEHQIDGAVETPTDGAIKVAENEIGNESVKISSSFGKQYSVDYQAVVKCPICCLNYDNISLSKHLEQHSMKFPYVCDHCLHTFGTLILFENHLIIHCENECFRCLECGCKFRQVCSLRNHMTTVHGRTPPHHQNSQYDASKSHSQMKEHSKFDREETLNIRNQYGKQENHQSVLYISNTNSEEKTEQNTCSTPGDQGSQDNGENDSRVLRRTTPSDSFPFNHPNNYHTAYHEYELVTSFMNNARGQNNIETGKRLAPEEAAAFAPKLNKARMTCPLVDERTRIEEEQQIIGTAETTTDGVGGVAENESGNESVKIYSYLGKQYAVDYQSVVKCPICFSKYDTIFSMRKHLQQHNLKSPFFCDRCLRTFVKRIHLEDHLILHYKNECFRCLECGCEFVKESAIRTHITLGHKGPPPHHQSSQCDNTSKRYSQMKTHCKRYHKEALNDGNKNGKQENHQSVLQTSKSSSKEITGLDTCNKSGDKGSQDNGEKDSQLVIRWTTTGNSCPTSPPYNCHTQYHEHELLTSSLNNASGQNNVETVKSRATGEVSACALKVNEARIDCSQLDERIQMQQQLTDGPADIATDDVDGVAENGSARDCIESYFWLGNHSYSVNYGDIHKCPFCDERCNILSFKKHLQHHRFEAPYKCEFCKSSFKSLDGLENHLIMHSGNYSYKCQTCSRKFSREQAVRLHIACKHNKTENNLNQSDKEENHQNALNTSTSSSNEITNPDTCTLMNIDNQDNSENSTQLDLRNTAPDGPCSSSRLSDSRTDYSE